MLSGAFSKRTAFVAVLAVGFVAESAIVSQPTAWAEDLATQSERVADIVEGALPSVVNISTTKLVNSGNRPIGSFGNRPDRRLGKSLGSGVIVSNRGFVLTNNHVVDGARDIMVGFSDGRELSATVVGADPNSDLAVLKLQGKGANRNLIPIKIGRSAKMRLGETVLAIGNPFGVGQTVTQGIVSAKGRANMGILDYEDFIQTDAAINPGNSGGALINMRGELIGINTAIISRTGGSQGIGFAIPTDIAKPIMKSLIKNGRVSRGYLGVAIQTVKESLVSEHKLGVDRGVLITGVEAKSPARKSGLKRHDVVVDVNGSKTNTAAQFRTKIASLGAGSTVALKVARGKRKLNLRIRLAEFPKSERVAAGKKTSFGVSVASLNSRLKRQYELPNNLTSGVVITALRDKSRAAEIGLLPGDVILEVNRREVKTPRQFQSAYAKSKSRVALLIYRDQSTVYVVIPK